MCLFLFLSFYYFCEECFTLQNQVEQRDATFSETPPPTFIPISRYTPTPSLGVSTSLFAMVFLVQNLGVVGFTWETFEELLVLRLLVVVLLVDIGDSVGFNLHSVTLTCHQDWQPPRCRKCHHSSCLHLKSIPGSINWMQMNKGGFFFSVEIICIFSWKLRTASM